MTTAPDIIKEEWGGGGRFVARVAGSDEVAELTFSKLVPDLVIANHTGVPERLEGKGIGKALVEALAADAAKEGYRIIPRCWFVRLLAQRRPEWAAYFDLDA